MSGGGARLDTIGGGGSDGGGSTGGGGSSGGGGSTEVGESSEGDSRGGAGDLTNDDKGGVTEGRFTGGATDGRLVAGGGGLYGLSTLLNVCCTPASFAQTCALEVSRFSRSSHPLFGCSGGGSTGHSISHCVAPLFWLKRLAKKTPTGFGGSSLADDIRKLGGF